MDTNLRNILPDLPPELDEAGKYQMREKALGSQLHAFGQMSDEWIANMVRGLMRNDLWHEAICCAARDRIMKLSLQLTKLPELLTALIELEDAASVTSDSRVEAARRAAREIIDKAVQL